MPACVAERQKLDTDLDFIFVSIKQYAKLSVRGSQVLLKNQSIAPHVLRHTFATISIEKGADIKAVSQILGHSSCKFTIDTYTHLSSSHVRAAMKKCNPLSVETISLEERIEGRKKHLAYLGMTG